MLAHLSRHRSGPRTAPWQAGARLRRASAVLAAVTCGLVAWAAAVPAAFATSRPLPPPGGQYGPVPVPATIVRVVTIGGMAGWQITLIAAGAALAAAAAVLLTYRARASRPRQNVSAAATAPAYDTRVLSGSDQIQLLSGAGPASRQAGKQAVSAQSAGHSRSRAVSHCVITAGCGYRARSALLCAAVELRPGMRAAPQADSLREVLCAIEPSGEQPRGDHLGG